MLGLLLIASLSQDPGSEFFEANIRPLLEERCTKCHGEEKQKAGLRLDLYGSILIGGESGAAITPGDVDASLLLHAVSYEDEFLQMPPRNQLTADELESLHEWVRMGAPGPATEGAGAITPEDFNLEERLKHWAYQPVKSTKPPSGDRPLSRSSWSRQPLDSFIERRLREEGLEPAVEADRATWLRRVHYGVTGLPPTVAEQQAFLEDSKPGAYERVIDGLLTSPHYGEKWARHWLDLVRYGEGRGHEFDYIIPNAYEYRDYLTRALNADVPYDRFVTEHIAGDLVEEPRLNPTEGFDESILGTGFWYLGEEVHSPVDIQGDESDRVANQIEVFSKTFLAMTVSCARCHDHKFDPIPTEDYYALAGFLHSSSYRQVLFESLHKNTLVAEALAELDAERGPDTRRSFAEALRPSLERVEERLHATREVFNYEPVEVDENAPFPEGLEVIFEDFEDGSWGAWEVEGDALGAGPPLLSDIPDYHKVKLKDWRGERFVCTHRNPEDVDSTNYDPVGLDARTGKLLSPEFTIEHDYLHFLICGGDDEQKTAVRLLVDGEVVLSRAGSKDGVFRPASFRMSEWRGKRARIEVADEAEGSWAHIGIDHIVFSNRSDSRALARAQRAEEQRAHFAAVQKVADQRGVDPDALSEWTLAVANARGDATDPLHAWAKLCDGSPLERAPKPAAWTMPPETTTVFSYEDASHPTAWIQDGNLFGPSPRTLGSASFSADPTWPIASFTKSAGAYVDPAWARLEFGFGVNGFTKSPSSATPGSLLNWNLSGRTLRTPTFLPEHGLVHYLVRGSGRCFAAIDSHRMIAGPLHAQSIKRFEAQRGWRWETHDLRGYVGHKVHLEFTPVEDASDFAIALVVEGPTQPSAPEEWSLELIDGGAFPATFAKLLGQAVDSLTTSEPSQGEGARDAATLLNWVALHPELFSDVDVDALSRAVSPHIEQRLALLNSIKTRPRSAPAMLDGSGVNERVFIRGNHTTPGDVVPRRLPVALPASGPIEATGSGRLELAQRLTKRENPLLARVVVNRIWHHLFGRGIVSSVDDFGKQGTQPTHPELLDHLADRFTEEGWSMKQLVRQIVLSSTYRQSIAGDPGGKESDPENLLLGRSPVRRLEAEAIRDGALAVSGSLDRTLYGPSVPVHLDAFMEGRGRPSQSGPIDGESRRSLYISIPRNFLSPFFKVFDRPIPFTTQGRRSASNVPAQSLAMMNDPLFEELAESWAKRIVGSTGEEGKRDREAIIHQLYQEAFARAPHPEETQRLLAFLGERDDESAWADVCHALFNVKEFIYLN